MTHSEVMSSSLAWLDFSEHERRKVLDVVKLFRDEGTVDELGVGAIRDGFSDLLFPGTSTLHTRAGYLLFIPWIYQQIEASEAKSRDPWKSAKNLEIRLIDELAESDESDGTIGINVRAALKTFPSTVYWAALGTFGLRLCRGSQDQYHRRVVREAGRKVVSMTSDEGEPLGAGDANWHVSPDPPQGFPRGVSFRLRTEDAAYLQQRITATARDASGRETLLAYMLAEGIDGEDLDAPWPLARSGVPAHLREQLQHASRFSLAINGAPLLYNLMLARKAKNADKQEEFEERVARWAAEVEAARDLDGWEREEFWRVINESPARFSLVTKRFVDDWLDVALRDPRGVASSSRLRELILGRERQVKGARARLVNPEALRLWGGDAGTTRLSYRWENVQRIVGDILSAPEKAGRGART